MTKSTSVQAIRLFNAMLKRAQDGRSGLTLTTWQNTLDFADREQVVDALNRLQHSEHIRIDIGGERPAIVILKGNYKHSFPLEKPLVLGMAPVPVFKVESTPGKELPPAITDLIPVKPDYVDVVQAIAAEVMPPAPTMPVAVTFVLDADDMEYLCERLDGHRDPLSLDLYAKELLEEYIRLLRAEDGPKHRLSAAVLKAAKDDGRPLPDFVTALIEIGLTAYQMNREAV
ncbi:hypothetical protein OOT33_13560 [Sphingobium sp. DEHP117]|uniref:hypothetical protein n=1 Tax=Sphingobium sp. DEHP117 TaxID=2993436 RepID=UPI0027D4C971|nr:hypothetical protein [Sphingobium sp. DEHP117]MDQ4421449.1 hypothetical protein [Sphingobium sp. DEHP117]